MRRDSLHSRESELTRVTTGAGTELPPLRWVVEPIPPPEQVAALVRETSLPAALASLLVQRGFNNADDARRFLRPMLDDLGDPLSLAGMAEAVDVVAGAVRAGTTIMVHGDYDVDGQCATALLTRTLRVAGAKVVPFIPHRLRDGYDFGPAGLAAAEAAGAGLIITCDCGITAEATVRAAQERGINVVVTDHHLPGPELPPARAVVDPQRPDDTSGLKMLCGTGIAFMLVRALVPKLGLPRNLPLHLLDLAALATVADVVPLVGVNRVIVRHGLRLMNHSAWVGLRALLAHAGLAGRELRSGHLGFVIGPRLNAAGRIGDPMDGLRLLLTDDAAEADLLAEQLGTLNQERQLLDQRMLEDALEQAEQQIGRAGIVLAGDDWHPGVVGIVASRVVERYGRPTFLVAFDGNTGRASGRSISRFDLHAALTECDDLLERFGGHHMAAGLTLRRDQLEAFRDRFAAIAGRTLELDELGPEQRVDLEISLADATIQLERLARHLEPCGMGNPGPVFGVRGVRFLQRQCVGANHLKGMLDDGTSRLPCIGFQWWDRASPWLGDDPVDVAFRLESEAFRGVETLQARLAALSPHKAAR